uniref:AB hydrolase-1 domain-containing protein n=1 Tax=Odontella aurita TaxID=265563 RepID=A0A7S4HPU6_9STRA|mmetsp:Transcript_13224/g.38898  ORF Transcript_13224/g.38898 Transcript_13224/m.38898 type:complete len:383 (+) Transcript_13224:258-1406(+)|eukprot:CAMPEP_0113534758 /NCGR_PEP_ID=MMETSP0015_2-20120614/5331_1 /TAXON_ID=2838 /ORGANISM="Odontella" /LENGTH=382 /DNA_ID=CAMNT_0000433943 /DNA_START=198 /DNA_END=1346 /DNA_ORIENTATION=- /assembly_acc=CAM_ASM_000160
MSPNTAMNFGGDDPDGAFLMTKAFSQDEADDIIGEDAILSESPRTVADMNAFLCSRVSTVLPSPPLTEQYEEGMIDVKRCPRQRRIRSGSICGPPSGGGDGLKSYKLAYRIYRPELLRSMERAPILALHGGPSLPSQYLHPIAEYFPDRSVIFYDQLGCGKSCSPTDVGLYSLSKSIDDLEALLLALKMNRFHLLGHSFGGVLAFEYCKKIAERAGREDLGWRDDPEVLSLTLSNSFTCAKLCDAERERLLGPIASHSEGDEEGIDDEFWRLHQCRLPAVPPILEDALQNWGVPWHERASSPLSSYAATAPSRWASDLPPALILRGEHDFVTPSCIRGWRESVWNHQDVAEVTLEGCAHYCHLEDKTSFGHLVAGFCKERDH